MHLLGNMKEGGLNNPPLSPRLCVTTHPAPVLKFSARVNASLASSPKSRVRAAPVGNELNWRMR